VISEGAVGDGLGLRAPSICARFARIGFAAASARTFDLVSTVRLARTTRYTEDRCLVSTHPDGILALLLTPPPANAGCFARFLPCHVLSAFSALRFVFITLSRQDKDSGSTTAGGFSRSASQSPAGLKRAEDNSINSPPKRREK